MFFFLLTSLVFAQDVQEEVGVLNIDLAEKGADEEISPEVRQVLLEVLSEAEIRNTIDKLEAEVEEYAPEVERLEQKLEDLKREASASQDVEVMQVTTSESPPSASASPPAPASPSVARVEVHIVNESSQAVQARVDSEDRSDAPAYAVTVQEKPPDKLVTPHVPILLAPRGQMPGRPKQSSNAACTMEEPQDEEFVYRREQLLLVREAVQYKGQNAYDRICGPYTFSTYSEMGMIRHYSWEHGEADMICLNLMNGDVTQGSAYPVTHRATGWATYFNRMDACEDIDVSPAAVRERTLAAIQARREAEHALEVHAGE